MVMCLMSFSSLRLVRLGEMALVDALVRDRDLFRAVPRTGKFDDVGEHEARRGQPVVCLDASAGKSKMPA